MVIRLFVILSLLIFSTPAFAADDEIALLRKQIKEMEARIDRLEAEKQKQPVVTTPQTVSQTTTATQNPSVEYGKGGGLKITSPDKNFQLRMSGYVQADNRTFLEDSSPSNNNNRFYIRSARPIIETKFYNDFTTRLMWDFGNGQTSLLDAYVDYNAADYANIRAGKFKLPLGIERWQSEQSLLFVERGLTNNLVPYRDNGLQIYGNIIPHML
ncbi:MAG: porin, partial [Pseudomonadota bacterium]